MQCHYIIHLKHLFVVLHHPNCQNLVLSITQGATLHPANGTNFPEHRGSFKPHLTTFSKPEAQKFPQSQTLMFTPFLDVIPKQHTYIMDYITHRHRKFDRSDRLVTNGLLPYHGLLPCHALLPSIVCVCFKCTTNLREGSSMIAKIQGEKKQRTMSLISCSLTTNQP